jgi:hypothetical protein
MNLLKVVAVVALLSVSRIVSAADVQAAFTQQKQQLAHQNSKKSEAREEGRTLAKEVAATQLDSRRDYVESFKSALQQAKEQQKKLAAEARENLAERRKL